MSATAKSLFLDTRQFGMKGDGVADDTAKFNLAREAARTSQVPLHIHGLIKITSALTITDTETWIGDGKYLGSRLIWGGSSLPTMVTSYDVISGGGMEGITLDCNNIADRGLAIDGSCSGLYRNVRIENFNDVGLFTTAADHTTSWNTFIGLTIGTASVTANSCIRLDGENGNTCHNSFYSSALYGPAGMPSIVLANCDNNSFHDTWTFSAGSAFGLVLIDPVLGSSMPVANYFYHLQAAWEQPGTTEISPGVIFGYDTANGQPLPVLNGSPGPIVYFAGGDEAYTAPTLLNSWVNFGSGIQTAGYCKSPTHWVKLKGYVKDGTTTNGTVIFNLPATHRPPLDEVFLVPAGTGVSVIVVGASGNVTISSIGISGPISLCGIQFRTAF